MEKEKKISNSLEKEGFHATVVFLLAVQSDLRNSASAEGWVFSFFT